MSILDKVLSDVGKPNIGAIDQPQKPDESPKDRPWFGADIIHWLEPADGVDAFFKVDSKPGPSSSVWTATCVNVAKSDEDFSPGVQMNLYEGYKYNTKIGEFPFDEWWIGKQSQFIWIVAFNKCYFSNHLGQKWRKVNNLMQPNDLNGPEYSETRTELPDWFLR